MPSTLPGEVDQLLDQHLHVRLPQNGRGGALMHEETNAHHPAVVQFAYQIVAGDTHIFKKDFIEFRLPSDLLERSDGDTWTLHIHDKTKQPLVFGHCRIGASQHKAKDRIVSITRPHFLPVNDELVTVLNSARL